MYGRGPKHLELDPSVCPSAPGCYSTVHLGVLQHQRLTVLKVELTHRDFIDNDGDNI